MKRPLLFMERVLYGNGTKPFNGVFALKIRGSVSAVSLRHALSRIQARHAMLRLCIQEDEKGIPWFVPPPVVHEIPVRIVERTDDDDWIRESVTEWRSPFDTKKGPMVRLVWLRSHDVSDLLISIHHCVFDGGSVLTFAHELLSLLDEPEKDIGSYTPFTSVRDLVPADLWNSRKNRLKGAVAGKLARFFIHARSKMLRPGKMESLPGNSDYLLHWKLDKEPSAALNKFCAARRVSTHTAMAAAFLIAFRDVRGSKARLKLECPVDIRPFVKEIRRDHLFAFGLSVGLALDRKKGTDFWSIVQKMQNDMSAKLAKLNGHEQLLMYENFHPVLQPLLHCLTYGKVTNDCMFSNLGRLDIPKTYRQFEVETIYSPTVLGPFNNPTTILTSVFRGQMDFSFISNQLFLPYEAALAIKEKAMELLMQNIPVLKNKPVIA